MGIDLNWFQHRKEKHSSFMRQKWSLTSFVLDFTSFKPIIKFIHSTNNVKKKITHKVILLTTRGIENRWQYLFHVPRQYHRLTGRCCRWTTWRTSLGDRVASFCSVRSVQPVPSLWDPYPPSSLLWLMLMRDLLKQTKNNCWMNSITIRAQTTTGDIHFF